MAGHPEPTMHHDPKAQFLRMTPESYIKERLIPHQKWYNSRYLQKKNWHYTLRVTTIVGGLVVAWLGTSIIVGKDMVISILGLAISGAGALESIFQFREMWKEYNSIALNMDNERTKFQTRSGEYRGLSDTDAFHLLVDRVESYNNQSSKDLVGVLTESSKG